MGYIEKIITGLLVFPFIAVLLSLPYAISQYHEYGSVSKFRTLIIYSFILYMLIAYFQIILPLPELEATAGNLWQDHLNLIPFRQIWLYWHDKPFSGAQFEVYLHSFSFWQLLFNILLTVPFGVYLHYYFKQDLKHTILYSFLLSLFYELTQLTALYGIYPGPYRLADVEDLICNTFGGVIGYQIAYVFALVLPKREEIDAHCRAAGTRVTGMRRFWAALFDYLCIYVIYSFLLGMIGIVYPGFSEYSYYTNMYSWSFYCLACLIQVLLTKGSTLGHAVCRMILVSEDGGRASAGQLFKRYFYLWLFTDFPLIIVNWLTSGRFPVLMDPVINTILINLPTVYYIWYLINVVFRKGKPMPHDRLSDTVYMGTVIPE